MLQNPLGGYLPIRHLFALILLPLVFPVKDLPFLLGADHAGTSRDKSVEYRGCLWRHAQSGDQRDLHCDRVTLCCARFALATLLACQETSAEGFLPALLMAARSPPVDFWFWDVPSHADWPGSKAFAAMENVKALPVHSNHRAMGLRVGRKVHFSAGCFFLHGGGLPWLRKKVTLGPSLGRPPSVSLIVLTLDP